MASQVKFPEVEERKTMTGPGDVPMESSSEKLWRKLREQPLVPLGCLATCGALIAASHHLRKGNREQFQKALRWRVGLQGVTVVAAVLGTMYLGSGSPAQSNDANSGTLQGITTSPGRPATVSQAAQADERRQFERAQLFERLREAELREEMEQKQRAEELLLRQSSGLTQAQQQNRSRPTIGQDRRDRSTAAAKSNEQENSSARAPSGPVASAKGAEKPVSDQRRLV